MSSQSYINVLIAEDNQVSREMMGKILSGRGFNILYATDGGEAIEMAKKHRPDLALVDINMAPTGGFEFVKYLVGNAIDLPVVIVTSDDSSDLLIEATGLGVQRVLQKPVAPNRLVDTVIHILKRRGFNPNHMGVETHNTRFSGDDLMRRAIELAEHNYKSGKGGPYGAVVANEKGEILGEGVNGILARSDPTAHAEVMAIRQAAEKLGRSDLKDCVLYVSSEPTMIGKALIVSVGINNVYYGLSHKDIKSVREEEKDISEASYQQIGHEEAMDMFQNWLKTRIKKT